MGVPWGYHGVAQKVIIQSWSVAGDDESPDKRDEKSSEDKTEKTEKTEKEVLTQHGDQ